MNDERWMMNDERWMIMDKCSWMNDHGWLVLIALKVPLWAQQTFQLNSTESWNSIPGPAWTCLSTSLGYLHVWAPNLSNSKSWYHCHATALTAPDGYPLSSCRCLLEWWMVDVLKYSGPKQDQNNSLGRQKYQNTESKRETANQNPFWIHTLGQKMHTWIPIQSLEFLVSDMQKCHHVPEKKHRYTCLGRNGTNTASAASDRAFLENLEPLSEPMGRLQTAAANRWPVDVGAGRVETAGHRLCIFTWSPKLLNTNVTWLTDDWCAMLRLKESRILEKRFDCESYVPKCFNLAFCILIKSWDSEIQKQQNKWKHFSSKRSFFAFLCFFRLHSIPQLYPF